MDNFVIEKSQDMDERSCHWLITYKLSLDGDHADPYIQGIHNNTSLDDKERLRSEYILKNTLDSWKSDYRWVKYNAETHVVHIWVSNKNQRRFTTIKNLFDFPVIITKKAFKDFDKFESLSCDKSIIDGSMPDRFTTVYTKNNESTDSCIPVRTGIDSTTECSPSCADTNSQLGRCDTITIDDIYINDINCQDSVIHNTYNILSNTEGTIPDMGNVIQYTVQEPVILNDNDSLIVKSPDNQDGLTSLCPMPIYSRVPESIKRVLEIYDSYVAGKELLEEEVRQLQSDEYNEAKRKIIKRRISDIMDISKQHEERHGKRMKYIENMVDTIHNI